MEKRTDLPKHLETGKIGEDIAVKWLSDREYNVLERNYRKKWGEIDIIAEKGTDLHFIEVKAVSYETRGGLEDNVSRGTYNPEERVHTRKQQRLRRAIETWMAGRNLTRDFQVDVLTVRLVPREKYAVIDVIENIVLK